MSDPGYRQLQRYLVERTRLGIPAIVHHEALAGPSSAPLPLTTTFTITGEPATLKSRTVHLTPSTIA